MRFFDTHTHLDYLAESLNLSIPELVENAKQHQVECILIVAVFAKNFAKVTACAKQKPENLVYGLGLHPLYIQQHQQQDLILLENLLSQQDPQCTAIAEIGLEKAVSEVSTPELWKKQCEFLEAQLSLAKKFNLPVNLHSRKSHDQLFVFLKKAQLTKTGVVHGFAGSYEQAKRFVDLGYKIGVGELLPMNVLTKPVRLSANYLLKVYYWKPTRPICRCLAFKASRTDRNGF
ncbi:D-aminoacyl-tRNA deacylase [Mannheimia haemolytica]